VRYAQPADHLLERLAAEHRDDREVTLVSSDGEIRTTAGQAVAKRRSGEFAAELLEEPRPSRHDVGSRVEDALDPATRSRLERWRRRRS